MVEEVAGRVSNDMLSRGVALAEKACVILTDAERGAGRWLRVQVVGLHNSIVEGMGMPDGEGIVGPADERRCNDEAQLQTKS